MPRVVPEVVAILTDLLAAAERGAVVDLFVVYRERAGEYGSAFWTHDLEDLLFQVRTETIYASGKADRDDPRH